MKSSSPPVSASRLPRSLRTLLPSLIAALAMAAAPVPGFGCSVCGCSLSSDWAAQGYSMMPGLQAEVRYEYYRQSELRRGTGTVDRAALALPNDEEIQQSTVNRNLWLDLDYVGSASWGVTLELPYHDRFHSTIVPGNLAVSTSQASGVGDVRIISRVQKAGLRTSYGLQFGLRLPTGRFDQDFATGPQAGELLDRGLQLGTGTTDVLVGASYFTRPSVSVGCFTQIMLDQPLNSREGYRPGTSLAFNNGVRFLTAGWLTPQMQLNVRWESRETGVSSDHENSGSAVIYLSPGLTADLSTRVHGFAFVQLPVFQRVNGLQLEPRWLLSAGLRCAF